jgi:hypothetical protein
MLKSVCLSKRRHTFVTGGRKNTNTDHVIWGLHAPKAKIFVASWMVNIPGVFNKWGVPYTRSRINGKPGEPFSEH